MEAVVVAPKAVGLPAVVAAKGMAVDGQVERAIHLAEGAAMHPLVVGKSKSGAGLA